MSIEIANESGVSVDEADLAALARHVLDGMRMHPLADSRSCWWIAAPCLTCMNAGWANGPDRRAGLPHG